MNTIEPNAPPKRSIGKLRKANKTKPRSPDMVGQIHLQRHILQLFRKQFDETNADEIVACLAAWKNYDADGPYLTIELSPKYVRRENPPADRSDLSFIFDNDEEA
jgi:hypothetical protein